MLKEGDVAPKFSLQSDKQGLIGLDQLKGKKVVLFFYPKDDTPGCTKESCEFSDTLPKFKDKNALVFGVSADNLSSHKSFSAKYNLNIPLLSDPDHTVSEAYGVWGAQEWQGKRYDGISRTTFVIDEQGKIAKIYRKVNPQGHAEQVLGTL